MKNELLKVCDQLAGAAANGVYQGIIITILVALCLRWLVRTNAATRHAIWFGTLLLLVALAVAHCLVDSFSLRRITSNGAAPNSNPAMPMPSENSEVLPDSETKTYNGSSDSSNFHEDSSGAKQHPLLAALIEAQPESGQDISEPAQRNGVEPHNEQTDDARLIAGISTADHRGSMARLLNPISVQLAVGPNYSQLARLLLVLWLMIAGLRVLALIAQLARIRKLKRQSLLPGAELSGLFQELSSRLVSKRKVELRVSPQHRSSFLLGFLRPVVLLPAEERMELEEAELVLRHELAHVERCDDWVNLIQHFVLAILFFHPACWWISRQLSLEREIACDDHVLQQSKRPQAYALVLANLAARMQRRLPLLAPGSSNNKTQLKERIDMILNTHRNASPRLAKTWLAVITSTAAMAAVAVICTAPRIVLAQNEVTTADAAIAPSVPVPPVPPANVLPVAVVAGLPHSADGVLATPPPPPVGGAGAKFKPGTALVLSTSPAVLTAPTVSLKPLTARVSVNATVPGQPPVLAAIEPLATPRPQPAPRPGKLQRSENRDASLEERLDRLEQMLNSLMNQQNARGRSDFQLKLENGMIDRKELARIEGMARQQAELAQKINPQEIERIKEQATREAKQAVEQAKRATAEVEKARKADQKQAVKKLKADSQRHLEDLRKQVEALERQREKLDREIERLEQDQDELDEQDNDSADIETELSESKEVCITESHSHSHSAR